MSFRLAILRAHVSAAATLMPILVRYIPLPRLVKVLAPPRAPRPYVGIPAGQIQRLVDQRLRKPRMMIRRACLRRGLLLLHFLKLAGIPSEIRFGVYAPRTSGQRMHGHCYIIAEEIEEEGSPEEPLTVLWTERF